MEDNNRNLILATVLSFLVIVVWYTLFAPEPPVLPDEPAAITAQDGAPIAPTATTQAAGGDTLAQSIASTGDPVADAPRVMIETPSLNGSISLAGGRLDDLLLTDYRATLAADSPYVRLLSPTAGNPANDVPATKPYYAVYGWMPAAGTDPALVPGPTTLWTLETGTTLSPGNPVTLVWDNGAGQIFRRTFEVDDKFLFTIGQSVTNNSATAFSAAPYGIIARHGMPDGLENFFISHEGVIGMLDGKLDEESYKDVSKFDLSPVEGRAKTTEVAENGWIGFTDKYWMAALAPAPGQPFRAVTKYSDAADIYQTETRLPVQTIAPGASITSSSYLFAGAKVVDTLRSYETTPGIQRFVDAVDWGWFYFFTKPIFSLLHWLHGLIGNMGWSIIALTVVLKALVFPLARKSYVSMAKMRELQPEMEAIKERTGEDRMKFQQEVMALYKREKVNPAAGCLPMLLQIPIFFSLYKVIFVTIELRHAPWLGWIKDLSVRDPSSVLNLFGLLPFHAPGPDSLFYILSLPLMALILGLSMWVQQKLNPAPTDPTQKMIFAWMPWVFMFMMGGFAAGLVLYWIANNIITIIQQYTIMSMHGHRPQLFGNIKEGLKVRRK
ncbi:MAG: membrane protein insertase YidC [Paracoccus sp. (in: a-proteobacteria)]|uniref:membrane protein insertase YidC n=1 Tax=Paracoccus sp. TaxID=267 RepID=UPI0026DEC369|nr:membrane protein insertase YidC [Paracoccus sp. (in: a-proteobacteria)]MDO5620731.1 membrane protein insertase YidC [Paracoccus sp. (in: a-proteobacteria)]